MKQRLGIAQAVIGSPNLVLLDEPTIALDKAGIECLKAIVAQLEDQDITIVIASHDFDFLKEVTGPNNVMLLENGQINPSQVSVV